LRICWRCGVPKPRRDFLSDSDRECIECRIVNYQLDEAGLSHGEAIVFPAPRARRRQARKQQSGQSADIRFLFFC
jgi:hypothetical protein